MGGEGHAVVKVVGGGDHYLGGKSMRRTTAAIAIVEILALRGGSASAEPIAPTGPWKVAYDTAQCVASREYGTDQKPLTLALKPSPNGGVMRMLILRKGKIDTHEEPATLGFGGERLKTNLLDYSDDKNGVRITTVNVPMGDFKKKLGTSSIGIDSAATVHLSFAVSELAGVTTELDKCLLDLEDYWNVGDKYKSRISAASSTEQPLVGLFEARDYPDVSLNRDEEGTVSITFLVDEKGRLRDCSVDTTSGIPALDTMSCYVLTKRAHIAPAHDAQGRAIRSAYTQSISWNLTGA
jgi:TonB family protein